MSTATAKTEDLSDNDVVEFLRNHPGFFLEHSELLSEITLNHDSGKAVSLMERQVEVLRDRNLTARARLHGLLDNAGTNEQIFNSTRALILALLETRNLAALNATLMQQLTSEFSIDEAKLTLFKPLADAGDEVQTMTREDAEARAPALIKNTQPLCGPLRDEEREVAFGVGSKVMSAGVVQLDFEGPIGLLALGSFDAQQFDPKMETDFLAYIAEVISRLLAPYVHA